MVHILLSRNPRSLVLPTETEAHTNTPRPRSPFLMVTLFGCAVFAPQRWEFGRFVLKTGRAPVTIHQDSKESAPEGWISEFRFQFWLQSLQTLILLAQRQGAGQVNPNKSYTVWNRHKEAEHICVTPQPSKKPRLNPAPL